jgi:hypothetical protein
MMRVLFPVQRGKLDGRTARSRRINRARAWITGYALVTVAGAWLLSSSIGVAGRDWVDFVQGMLALLMGWLIVVLVVVFALFAGATLADGGVYTSTIPARSLLRKGDLGLIRWEELKVAEELTGGPFQALSVKDGQGRLAQFGTYSDGGALKEVRAKVEALGIPIGKTEFKGADFVKKYTERPPRAGWKTTALREERARAVVKARYCILGGVAMSALALAAVADLGLPLRQATFLGGLAAMISLFGLGLARMTLFGVAGDSFDGHFLYGKRVPIRSLLDSSRLGAIAPDDIVVARYVEGGYMWPQLKVSHRRGDPVVFINKQEIADVLAWLRDFGVEVRRTEIGMEGMSVRIDADRRVPAGKDPRVPPAAPDEDALGPPPT